VAYIDIDPAERKCTDENSSYWQRGEALTELIAQNGKKPETMNGPQLAAWNEEFTGYTHEEGVLKPQRVIQMLHENEWGGHCYDGC
jgi:acetolactate synthase-1/2/3 large subunit